MNAIVAVLIQLLAPVLGEWFAALLRRLLPELPTYAVSDEGTEGAIRVVPAARRHLVRGGSPAASRPKATRTSLSASCASLA